MLAPMLYQHRERVPSIVGIPMRKRYEIIFMEICHINKDINLRLHLDGIVETGYADYLIIFNNKPMPIEAKYVKKWDKSFYNPEYLLKYSSWAPDEVGRLLHQAKRYNAAFSEVVYHTNCMELANYYTKLFNENGVKNFEFVITPIF